MKPIAIASERDVIEGRVLALEVQGRSVALCRIGGRVCAVKNECTHEEWSLTDGYVVDGRIVCSLHGAAFDPTSGACVRGPAEAPLETYPVEVRDGRVLVLVPDGDTK